MDTFFLEIIGLLQQLGPELLLLAGFFVCCIFMMLSFYLFGATGLVCYSVVAVLIANVQVLKLGAFSFLDEPIALGTVVFTSLFVASDIITEHYGSGVAKRAIYLSFLMQIFLMISMLTVIAHPGGNAESQIVQNSLEVLFTPSLRILVASLISFVISQYVDINIFAAFKRYHGRKKLWLRANISTLLSGLFDTFIFSFLAWIVFAPSPLSFKTVLIGFVGFSQAVRMIVSVISTPLLYLSYRLKPNE
jgi:uncharacterized integral membrane protein (TIGR00697 family)